MSAPVSLEAAISDVLARLDDDASQIWSRDEIALYLQDGVDQFCRRTKCLFDIVMIPNEPQIGSVGSDLQLYLAQQRVGTRIGPRRLHFTQDPERNYGVGGQPGGSYDGPTTPAKDA